MQNKILNVVNEIINTGIEKGILHLVTEDEYYEGRTITIEGETLINFSSCDYLGLGMDNRLKDAAIDAIKRYGLQHLSSRAYTSCTLYTELEFLFEQMFGVPVILTTSISLGHHGVLPILIQDGDVVIMDQQVHASVQDAVKKLQLNGVTLTIIRHNSIAELKKKIEDLLPKHKNIWYAIDGVYSMYGDLPPIQELMELLDQYKQFYIYADDAHGMSVFGKHGVGYVLSQAKLHPRIVLATGMGKAFGMIGGIFIIPNKDWYRKVRNCAGPLIFSGPIPNPILGAGIASAKIHLSEEIHIRQKFLIEKIQYCHKLLKLHNLPNISDPSTSIFFIALGLLRVGNNLVKRIKEEGFYVNLAVFPAVPEACTGLRFTINLHHSLEDIEKLVEALAFHFPKALQEEGRTVYDIQRAFKKVADLQFLSDHVEAPQIIIPVYRIEHETTITAISPNVWDTLLGNRGSFSWENLHFFEQIFSNNEKPEHNWDMHYYIIRDKEDNPVLATFFTYTLSKDDMLAPIAISKQVEEKRILEPYYLISTTMMMGAPLTEGNHLYLNRNNKNWKDILMCLLDTVWKEQEKQKANVLYYRDFNADDQEISTFFLDQGFAKTVMPDTHIIEEMQWNTKEEFLNQLHKRRRQYLQQKVFKCESYFDIEIKNHGIDSEIEYLYNLYCNVGSKNVEINSFLLPKKFFEQIIQQKDWEIIEIKLKPQYDSRKKRQPIAVMFSYKGSSIYSPILVGIDYNYLEQYHVYAQILWQTVWRAHQLNSTKINLGFTASQNKRKFGAKAIPQVGFVQMVDNYSVALLNSLANTNINS